MIKLLQLFKDNFAFQLIGVFVASCLVTYFVLTVMGA